MESLAAKNKHASPGEEWILIAHVGRPHGLKGAFFVKTKDRRTEWGGYVNVLLECQAGFEPRNVLRTYVSGQALAMCLEGLENRETTESFYDKRMFVSRKEIAQAGADEEYLVHDLEGMAVTAAGHGLLGHVVSVGNFGAQENLEIKLVGSEKTVFFPFIEPFVKNVDMETRSIEIEYVDTFFETFSKE